MTTNDQKGPVSERAEVLEWVRQRDYLNPLVALDMWSPVLAEDSGWPVSSVHVLTGWTEDWSRSAVVVVDSAAEAARLVNGWRELVPAPLNGHIAVYVPVPVMAQVQAVVGATGGIDVIGYTRDERGQLQHGRNGRLRLLAPSPRSSETS